MDFVNFFLLNNKEPQKSTKNPKQIVKPANHEQIIDEINFLKEGDYQLLQSKNYEVFLAQADKMPNMLREIGRLRELAFRAAGGGTGKKADIDDYDIAEIPYHQLIVWDPAEKEIVGGYRFIIGNKVEKDDNGYPKTPTAKIPPFLLFFYVCFFSLSCARSIFTKNKYLSYRALIALILK